MYDKTDSMQQIACKRRKWRDFHVPSSGGHLACCHARSQLYHLQSIMRPVSLTAVVCYVLVIGSALATTSQPSTQHHTATVPGISGGLTDVNRRTATDAACRPANGGAVCSGRGWCRRGRCKCARHGAEVYTGDFCHICPSCPAQCGDHAECVRLRLRLPGAPAATTEMIDSSQRVGHTRYCKTLSIRIVPSNSSSRHKKTTSQQAANSTKKEEDGNTNGRRYVNLQADFEHQNKVVHDDDVDEEQTWIHQHLHHLPHQDHYNHQVPDQVHEDGWLRQLCRVLVAPPSGDVTTTPPSYTCWVNYWLAQHISDHRLEILSDAQTHCLPQSTAHNKHHHIEPATESSPQTSSDISEDSGEQLRHVLLSDTAVVSPIYRWRVPATPSTLSNTAIHHKSPPPPSIYTTGRTPLASSATSFTHTLSHCAWSKISPQGMKYHTLLLSVVLLIVWTM